MSVLLIAEHNNKELKSFTLNAVTAASQIDSDVHALVIGIIVVMLQKLPQNFLWLKK
jgi:electron transfer flavoprotein alpha subunit